MLSDANYRYAPTSGSMRQAARSSGLLRKIYPNMSRINESIPMAMPGPPVLTGCLGGRGSDR